MTHWNSNKGKSGGAKNQVGRRQTMQIIIIVAVIIVIII